MSEFEKQQAEEIAVLQAKLAAAERDRDRSTELFHREQREKETLERVFVRLLSQICQRD